VLVGYDGSPASRLAVAWAADEAARRGVPLAVAYAADYTGLIGGPFGASWLPDAVYEAAEGEASAGAAVAKDRHPQLDVTTHAYAGSPGDVLVRESRGCGLVVVGTRGLGELAACIRGSVASYVAAHALSPVVVVRGEGVVAPGPGHPVVVAVDGTRASDAALRFAVTTAQETGAPLTVACAWLSALEDWTRAYWLAADPSQDPDKSAREAAERVAAAAGARAESLAPGLAVDVHTRGGRPSEVILEIAGGDAGMVVVGSRGRGSVAGLLLGSVGHEVVHGARCPVAVVRDDGEGSGTTSEDQADRSETVTPA
jgi:nucleotide-binding universal stress UspA family protein